MADRHTCEANIYRRWESYSCNKVARFQEEGKWWCGTHLPSRVVEKRVARNKVWQKASAAREATWQHEAALKKAREEVITVAKKLVGGTSSFNSLSKAVVALEVLEQEANGSNI